MKHYRYAKTILDNLWGPMGTIIVHLIIVAFLFRFVVTGAEQEDPTIVVKHVTMKVEPPLDELIKDLEQELDAQEPYPLLVTVVTPPSVAMDREPPMVDPMMSARDITEIAMPIISDTTSILKLNNFYSLRSHAGREQGLAQHSHGLGVSTEYAVRKALTWLKNHQEPDGAWGPQYRVAMTGLALLAFFAHGETNGSPDYGPAIQRGLRFLLKRQKNGMFVGGGPRHPRAQIAAYEHAIGTYAISEAYGLTGIPELRPAMEDAIQVILDGQHEGGCWDYGYVRGPKAHIDVSLAGWHIQALKAGLIAKAENTGLTTAIDNATGSLRLMFAEHDGTARFAYSTRAPGETPGMPMTGVAVLCMQLTGNFLDAEARAGINALKRLDVAWSDATAGGTERGVGRWPLYAWYYITQARFHQGGLTWVSWNRQFAPTLCAMQNPNGSWCPAPNSSESAYGPVYCTALPCLMLQVYYRLLPTYQQIETCVDPREDETARGDFVIKFSEA